MLRSGGLRDALKAGSRLAYGCFRVVLTTDDKDIDAMNPVGCTKAHGAEFVGIWTAPDTSYADFEKNSKRTHGACRSVLARFAKVPEDRALEYRSGTIYYYPAEDQWKAGDRGVQCFLWLDDRTVNRSMKGAGPKVLKIR